MNHSASPGSFPWEEKAGGSEAEAAAADDVPTDATDPTHTADTTDMTGTTDTDATDPTHTGDRQDVEAAEAAAGPPAGRAPAADAARQQATDVAGRPAARRPDAPQRPLVRKEYYSISEVGDIVGLPAHVLRYWESQFSVLNPSKNRSGNRVYQRKEIKLILLVKQLLHDEKYTVEGAKQKLEQLRRGGAIGEAAGRALDEQLVQVLRDDLLTLSQILGTDRG